MDSAPPSPASMGGEAAAEPEAASARDGLSDTSAAWGSVGGGGAAAAAAETHADVVRTGTPRTVIQKGTQVLISL